jgi:hypothetical protein
MAVEVTSGSNRTLYTGLASLKIKAVNPTMAELIAMGIPATQEPVYTNEVDSRRFEGEKCIQTRLEFHYVAADNSGLPEGFSARASMFLRYEEVDNFYISKFGRFASSVKNPDGYAALLQSDPNIRLAWDGEMDLMMQLENLCNPRKGSVFTVDSIAHVIYSGNVAELSDILQKASKNTIQGVLGVQTTNGKQYQTLFRRTQAAWMTRYEKLIEAIYEREPHNKDTYYGPIPDLALRVYDPTQDKFAVQAANVPQAGTPAPAAARRPAPPAAGTPAPRAAAGTPGGAPTPQQVKDNHNDLPF